LISSGLSGFSARLGGLVHDAGLSLPPATAENEGLRGELERKKAKPGADGPAGYKKFVNESLRTSAGNAAPRPRGLHLIACPPGERISQAESTEGVGERPGRETSGKFCCHW
jgi:hypothetical protein